MRVLSRFTLACVLALAAAAPALARGADKPAAIAAAAGVAELRRSFTLDGKPVPPEIFRDFGDGDLADSGPIWVSVDIAAAIGSNRYADAIKSEHGWFSQKKASPDGGEETGYRFIGATANGLLVVLASYSGGGSGDFITLHILDVAAVRAYDNDGNIYWRINLTVVRSTALGDRWDGEVKIAGNRISIVTTRSGPADASAERRPRAIVVRRP